MIHWRLPEFKPFRSNTYVTTIWAVLNSCGHIETPQLLRSMFTLPENKISRLLRPQLAIVLVFAALFIAVGGNVATAADDPGRIEAVLGTAVEIRAPSAVVIASNAGLVTLNFDLDSELRIGSRKITVTDIAEGDRVISTARRNSDGDLIALKTLVRTANAQPTTKHVVGVVTEASDSELSIQTRNGDVVDVLIPAGIDAPSIGDGITMVARLDHSSGILTAVGFELTRTTVERIQAAQERAANQAEAARLAQIAIDARSEHLSALDNTARALKRVVESNRVDQATLEKASVRLSEIQRRFRELRSIYERAAQNRNEAEPLLKISGALVDEISANMFTIVPKGEQEVDPFTVIFSFDPDTTTADLPHDLLVELSDDATNPQFLTDVSHMIDPGSDLDVKYTTDGDDRLAVSITVRQPRLVEELEAVLEHESLRAFHGVITFVEIDHSLANALGVVIAANENRGLRVAAKVTSETEITLDGESSDLQSLRAGQAVDIQFESSEAGSISEITGSDVTLRALAIRARSLAHVEEDHTSGIVESIEVEVPAITIRPTDGPLIRLLIDEDASIVRNGQKVSLESVKEGDLVIDAVRSDSESEILTRLVVVAHSNVKFTGTITGIGREPTRLQVTGENGRSLNILITDDTWLILDGRRVKFSSIGTGMRVVSGVYSVTGRGGALYNVGTIISVETPKVGRASGTVTGVNVVEGTLTILAGESLNTQRIHLRLPEHPLGANLLKDGIPIRSLLEVERGDWVDIVFYVLETGIIEKLSVVSDNYMQSRGTLLGISDNNRIARVELSNGEEFELWVGASSTMQLNGRRIATLRPMAELLRSAKESGNEVSALIPEILFYRDSVDSNLGVIISAQFQVKVGPEIDTTVLENALIELTVTGIITAISGDTWVIGGQVFTVVDATRFIGAKAEVGVVAVAVLVSRPGGTFTARTVSVIGQTTGR